MVAAQYKITNASMFPLEAHSKNQHAQDAVLSKLEQDMTKIVKQFIKSRLYIKTFIDSKIDKLFDFRIMSLNWLIKNRMDFIHSETDLKMILTEVKADHRFSFLYQSLEFAIRTNIQGLHRLVPPSVTEKEIDFANWQPIQKQSLKSYFSIMQLASLPFDFELYQKCVIASLQIEFVLMSISIIQQKQLAINSLKINQLSFFVVQAAQMFEHATKAMTVETKPLSSKEPLSFLEEMESWTMDETPINMEEIIQNHAIQWDQFSVLQKLFEDAPFDEMEKCLDA